MFPGTKLVIYRPYCQSSICVYICAGVILAFNRLACYSVAPQADSYQSTTLAVVFLALEQ